MTKNGHKKRRRRVAGEKRRVNLKIEEGLAEWAFSFAERNNTSVTGLITDYLSGLRDHEKSRSVQDAEQI